MEMSVVGLRIRKKKKERKYLFFNADKQQKPQVGERV